MAYNYFRAKPLKIDNFIDVLCVKVADILFHFFVLFFH